MGAGWVRRWLGTAAHWRGHTHHGWAMTRAPDADATGAGVGVGDRCWLGSAHLSLRRMVVPRSGLLLAVSSPSCALASLRAMYRPRPMPPNRQIGRASCRE